MMVVAIDGPAGVGKSTVASRAARRAGFLYLNSGGFYRLITREVLDSHTDPDNTEAVIHLAERCHFEVRGQLLYLNGKPATGNIHTDSIDRWVAPHSSISKVREVVNSQLKGIVRQRNVIVEGRDISTVVFPEAEVKIYLDASLEVRAHRRHLQGVSELSIEEIKNNLRERDKVDANKPIGRLEKSVDALYIDTSDLTIDQVCERVISEIQKKQDQSGA